jgi:uncharacterized protein YjbI with pentapeptide repeats
MANDEHVALLKQGLKAWNSWREKSSAIRPNLFDDVTGADLTWADLSEAYLKEANLSGADLVGADLSGWGHPHRWNLSRADLSEANLSSADLSWANLRGAHLNKANLSEAILNRANLRGAHLNKANLSGLGNLTWADLSWANLSGANLSGAHLGLSSFSRANLSGADLSEAHLFRTYLSRANLSGADLSGANLRQANLSGADLRRANLRETNLSRVNLRGADLSGADLEAATLLGTDLTFADLTGCRIYGVSAWSLKLEGAKQQKLVITQWNEPEITVDNIEVGQFIYLLLHNEKLQRVIDTITTKVVLILGRFSLPERKEVLNALRSELRKTGRDYVPVVFDFEKPKSGTTINTIMLLARMARFVIADISDAKSVLQELQAIVPSSPKLPVQSIIVSTQEEPGMFDAFQAYPWFLSVHRYETAAQLLAELDERVIGPAEAEVARLRT